MEGAHAAKWASLLAFGVQNSVNPIIFRYAATESQSSERASTSAVLFFTELLKFILSFLLLGAEESFSPYSTGKVVYLDWLSKPRESLPLAVPAVIYLAQNALLQWSSGHLSAPLWQVTYQGKILVTAAFSVTLLRKEIHRVQWLAILIMGLGIASVQLSGSKESKQAAMANASEQSLARGLVMLLLACCCSGFASVFTERVFKQAGAPRDQKKKSVWLQNMQLASFSVLVASWGFVTEMVVPGDHTGSASMIQGFTGKTWGLVLNNAVGGLLVALVIKHADNILRGFASAIATINATVISVFCFGFVLRASFGLGTVMVIGSTLLYGKVLRLPGEWWNSELRLCGSSRAIGYTAVGQALPSQADDVSGSNGVDTELPQKMPRVFVEVEATTIGGRSVEDS